MSRASDFPPRIRLQEAYGRWAAAPFHRHAAAVLTLALILGLGWWSYLSQREPLADELIYCAAFRAVEAGRSPASAHGYLYFPLLALVGARLKVAVGLFPVLLLLRLLNTLGLATTLWLSMAWLPGRWRWRIPAAATLAFVAPAYRFGMTYGNLSLAVSGLILAGLLFWARRPWLCGVLLGVSIAVKPLAPVAVGLLASHRSEEEGSRHRLAAVVGVLVSCLLVFGLPYSLDNLSRAGAQLASRTISWHRLPYILGWRLHPAIVFLLVACGAFLLVRRRPLGRWLFLAVALTATLAATPLVWSHTLVLTLPIQILALQVAVWRWQAKVREGAALPALSPWRRFEPMLVLLAIAALQFSEGATGIDDQAALLQLVATLPPALAPAALTAYLMATTGAEEPVPC